MVSIYLSSIFFSSPNLSSWRLDVYHTSFHTWCGPSANLECRSEMCSTRLAGNSGPKNDAKIAICARSHKFVERYLRNNACIDNRKNLLNSNISSTCPYNMANFGPLTAEIGSGVWGTPYKFQRVLRLGSVIARHLVVGVSQTLRR